MHNDGLNKEPVQPLQFCPVFSCPHNQMFIPHSTHMMSAYPWPWPQSRQWNDTSETSIIVTEEEKMIGGNNEPYDIYVTSSDIDVLHNNFTTAIAMFDKCGQCSETIVVVINDHFYCFGGKSSALPFNYTFILCFIIVLLVMSLVIFSFLATFQINEK